MYVCPGSENFFSAAPAHSLPCLLSSQYFASSQKHFHIGTQHYAKHFAVFMHNIIFSIHTIFILGKKLPDILSSLVMNSIICANMFLLGCEMNSFSWVNVSSVLGKVINSCMWVKMFFLLVPDQESNPVLDICNQAR